MTFDRHNQPAIDMFGPYIGKALQPYLEDGGNILAHETTISVGKLRKEIRKHVGDKTSQDILDAIHAPEFRALLDTYIQNNFAQTRFCFRQIGIFYTLMLFN